MNSLQAGTEADRSAAMPVGTKGPPAISIVTRFGYVLLWFIPLWYLLPFASAALYSSPSTDDFCLASSTLGQAVGAVHQYYVSVTGRLPALAIITMPSLLASATGLDLFAVYPVFNVVVIVLFAGAMMVSATWLLRTDDYLLGGLLGLLSSTLILSLVPNISEFVYWVTGEACYLTAAVGASLFAAWATGVALNRNRIGISSLCLAILVCAFTAMFNEFTAFFLLGAALLSLLFRVLVMRREAQAGYHVAIIATILLSYCVVFFSPSNAIRLGAYRRSGDIGASFDTALIYLADYAIFLGKLEAVQSFGILAVCFGIATTTRISFRTAAQNMLFAVGLLCLGAVWAFSSYFIGAYSTGEVLALRARNELVAVEVTLLTTCIVIWVQAVLGSLLQFQKREMPRTAGVAALLVVAFGTWQILPVTGAPTYVQLRDEWPQLVVYWRESLARNSLLSTTSDADVTVSRRTAMPRLLAGDELKETPLQLPNDCIARFYKKSTVVLAHQDLGVRP
ncbi:MULTISPECIES: hypothetical protein [unclassified Bradyrhizobium]